MSEEYSRGILRVVVAQLCQQLGWNSIHAMPLELLTDVLERYLLQMGRVTHRYTEQFGRTTPRLEDVFLAFSHMGLKPSEVEDYATHMDLVPFAKDVVSYPVPSENDLKFPNPDSREVQQRKVFEFVPEHLPYMHPELNEDFEDGGPGAPGSPDRLQVDPQSQGGEMSPGQGEKRPLSSPGDPGAPFKRPRLTTSQLPEEAFHTQHEMTSVVMTNSGILSPLREGKLPDTKAPPTGFKQIVIVKQKSSSGTPTPGAKLPPDTPIIKLDFSQDKSGTSKIVEVDKDTTGIKVDKSDPDFNPKKKKVKELKMKKSKQLKEQLKVKRGPGRPKSPGRAVVHNKGSADISKILQLSRKDDLSKLDAEHVNDDAPMDLSVKPTPPVHNISVHVDESARSKKESQSQKIVDYRPKNVALSKQQEKDMEDTIASVIENSSREMDSRIEEAVKVKKERSVSPHSEKVEVKSSESKKDTWRVSHISETYIGSPDESFETADDFSDDKGDKSPPNYASDSYNPPGKYVAPHLAFLHHSPTPTKTRGRPRGSTSNVLSRGMRSPSGRRPGRPPLNRSPGRAGSVARSPGRPPLNRSPGPGRPALNRSPGRPPGSGRSPGRPKGSVSSTHSPKPRGRPRGSKSPRNRGFSPRGGSPRAVANINFDENVTGVNSRILKEHGEESETRLFDLPSRSPGSPGLEDYLKASSPGPSSFLKNEQSPSPAASPKPDRTPDRREVSPSPSASTGRMSIKREPTPDAGQDSHSAARDSSVESERFVKREKSYDDTSPTRPASRADSYKESAREKEDRSQSREKENRLVMSFKDRSSERETSQEKEKIFKGRDNSSEREYRVFSSSDRDRSQDRSHERSHDRSHERSHDRDHKEHSRDREGTSKERDRERSKEHKKDKKKKKKKDKDRERDRDRDRDRDKDRDRDRDREKKDKHKKDKEPREESPSVQPLQKLTIKFGGGGSSTKSSKFSISTPKPSSSPKPEAASPPQRPEIPKLKFKVLPPKSDSGLDKDRSNPEALSWKSSVKTERRTPSPKPVPSPKPEPVFSSHKSSPRPDPDYSKKRSPAPETKIKPEPDVKDSDGKGQEEVTVSLAVVGGKILGQKPVKRKRKGSKGKGRPKTETGYKKLTITPVSSMDNDEDTQPAMESEPEKDDPLSPLYPNQNVPSPITIPALKAAPPPPSPPTNNKKSSPPKPKSLRETRPQSRSQSPLFKDLIKPKSSPKESPKPKPSPLQIPKPKPSPVQISKPKPPPVQIPKATKATKASPRRSSPRKSPKISPLVSKKKAAVFSQTCTSPTKTEPPPSKSSSFSDSQPPLSPTTSRVSSPSFSPLPSPMYSPASSPARDSPLHFMIPPTPAFPTRSASPPMSPLSRQMSTDDEKEATPPVERPKMPPPAAPLPPMPPSSSQKKGKSTVVAETVGSFVNDAGEKIWICPACTMQDDGSPMIGCDMCDDWYHWPCVNIQEEPSEEESWYCPKCAKPVKSKGKRGRKKKKP